MTQATTRYGRVIEKVIGPKVSEIIDKYPTNPVDIKLRRLNANLLVPINSFIIGDNQLEVEVSNEPVNYINLDEDDRDSIIFKLIVINAIMAEFNTLSIFLGLHDMLGNVEVVENDNKFQINRIKMTWEFNRENLLDLLNRLQQATLTDPIRLEFTSLLRSALFSTATLGKAPNVFKLYLKNSGYRINPIIYDRLRKNQFLDGREEEIRKLRTLYNEYYPKIDIQRIKDITNSLLNRITPYVNDVRGHLKIYGKKN